MFSSIAKAERTDSSKLLSQQADHTAVHRIFEFLLLILPLTVLVIDISLHWSLPNKQSFSKTAVYPLLLEALIALYVTFLIFSVKLYQVRKKILHLAPLLTGAFILIEVGYCYVKVETSSTTLFSRS